MENTETITKEQLADEYKTIMEKPQRRARGSNYDANLKRADDGEIVKIEGLHYSMKNRYTRLAKENHPDLVVLFETTGEDPSLKIRDNNIYRVVLVKRETLSELTE